MMGWLKKTQDPWFDTNAFAAGNKEYIYKSSIRVCQLLKQRIYTDTSVNIKSSLTTYINIKNTLSLS